MWQLVTRRWLLTHALVIGTVLLFVRLGLWQLQRGESGHLSSYAYALEWPTFALLVVGFWVKIIYTELHTKTDADVEGTARTAQAEQPSNATTAEAAGRTGIRARRFTHTRHGADTGRDAEVAELAAYNRYVADLAKQRDRQ